MFLKVLILALLALILFFLGQGFYQIFIKKITTPDDPYASRKAVKMLTWRVCLSLSLLAIIVLTKLFVHRH